MPRLHWSLCLIAVIGLIAACGETPPSESDEGKPDPEPKVTEATAEVKSVTLTGLMDLVEADDTKPVVVNLWAHWCPPCVEETPILIEFAEKLGDKADFISVSMDFAENKKGYADVPAAVTAMEAAAKGLKIPFTVYVADTTDSEASGWYSYLEVDAEVPATVFFDKNGMAKASHKTFESVEQAMAWFDAATKAE